MKRVTRVVLLVLGLALVVFNLFTLDYNQLWSSESQVSWIGVIAGVCAVLLVLISQSSLRVQSAIKKAENRLESDKEEQSPLSSDSGTQKEA